MGGGTWGAELGAWANCYLVAQCMGRTRVDVENVFDFNLMEVPQRRICEYRRGRGCGWMWRKRMLTVGRQWSRIFQSKKYSSAGDLYLDGVGAGAKRMSAHGRSLCGGVRKHASKRSCCSALSLSRWQEIESEGIFDGVMVGLVEGFGMVGILLTIGAGLVGVLVTVGAGSVGILLMVGAGLV